MASLNKTVSLTPGTTSNSYSTNTNKNSVLSEINALHEEISSLTLQLSSMDSTLQTISENQALENINPTLKQDLLTASQTLKMLKTKIETDSTQSKVTDLPSSTALESGKTLKSEVNHDFEKPELMPEDYLNEKKPENDSSSECIGGPRYSALIDSEHSSQSDIYKAPSRSQSMRDEISAIKDTSLSKIKKTLTFTSEITTKTYNTALKKMQPDMTIKTFSNYIYKSDMLKSAQTHLSSSLGQITQTAQALIKYIHDNKNDGLRQLLQNITTDMAKFSQTALIQYGKTALRKIEYFADMLREAAQADTSNPELDKAKLKKASAFLTIGAIGIVPGAVILSVALAAAVPAGLLLLGIKYKEHSRNTSKPKPVYYSTGSTPRSHKFLYGDDEPYSGPSDSEMRRRFHEESRQHW